MLLALPSLRAVVSRLVKKVWTSKDTHPNLWRHDIGSWWYLMGRKGSVRAFYAYAAKEWKEW
jgi:hypothetical protein